MSSWLRSLLITLGTAVLIFLSLSAWYWLRFKEPPQNQLYLLRRAMPAVEQLLDAHEDAQAAALLDKIPFKIVVSDLGQQALTSNLGNTLRLRRELGQQALKSKSLENFLIEPDGDLRFYYREPLQIWDHNLLFPLIFGLLLGLIAALWDFLQGQQLENQTDALILMNQQYREEDEEDEDEREALEAQVLDLQKQLESLQQKRIETGPSPQQQRLEQELSEAQQKILNQEKTLTALRKEHHEQAEDLKQLRHQAQDWQNQETAFKRQQELDQEEITLLYQEQQRLTRDLEQAHERLDKLGQETTQLHEAWQEIERLRLEQTELLRKEELWQNEKQRVLGLIHEKEEQSAEAQKRLNSARQKIRELSVAYKKLLESNLNLPEDLVEIKNVIDGLIEEKDLVEQENAHLQIDLADRDSEIKRLRTELSIRAERLEQAQKMIDELSQHLNKNERELGLLSETLEDKMHDLERIKDLHDEDQQVLEELTQERDSLRTRVADMQSEMEELRHSKNQLLFAKEQLEEQLESLDVPSYDLEIEQLKKSLHLMGLQQQRRTQTVETLKEKLKDGENLYKRLKKHAETQEQEIRNLQQDIGRYRSEIQLLEKKLELA